MKNFKIKFLEIIHDDLLRDHHDNTHWLANCTEAMGTARKNILKAFGGHCSGQYLLRIIVTWCHEYSDTEKDQEMFLRVWLMIGQEVFKFSHSIEDIDAWNAKYSKKEKK